MKVCSVHICSCPWFMQSIIKGVFLNEPIFYKDQFKMGRFMKMGSSKDILCGGLIENAMKLDGIVFPCITLVK